MYIQNLPPFPTFSEVFTLFLPETYNLFELGEECWHNAGKDLAQHSVNGSTLASSNLQCEEVGLKSYPPPVDTWVNRVRCSSFSFFQPFCGLLGGGRLLAVEQELTALHATKSNCLSNFPKPEPRQSKRKAPPSPLCQPHESGAAR